MNLDKNIRKLARSSYYQHLYRISKDINGVSIFQNMNNFSGLQSLFLYWLKVYNILFDELSNKEHDNLTSQVILDDIRVDAFLHYRTQYQQKKLKEYKQKDKEYKLQNRKGKNTTKFQKFPLYTKPSD